MLWPWQNLAWEETWQARWCRNRNPLLGLLTSSFLTWLNSLPAFATLCCDELHCRGLIAPCPDQGSSFQEAPTGSMYTHPALSLSSLPSPHRVTLPLLKSLQSPPPHTLPHRWIQGCLQALAHLSDLLSPGPIPIQPAQPHTTTCIWPQQVGLSCPLPNV